LKRRRRLNTYTIQRKRTKQVQRRPAAKEPGPFWTLVKFLIIIGLIILIGYFGFKYLLPAIQQKLPSLHLGQNTSSVEAPVTSPPKALPVEKPPQKAAEQNQPSEPQSSVGNDSFVRAIQVEILNGCGQQGVAKTLAAKLKNLKYDVVNTGNYLRKGRPYFKVSKTRMIDQLNTKESRKKCLNLAKQIGISEKQVQSFSNPNPIADITIIIGQDYKKLPVFKGTK